MVEFAKLPSIGNEEQSIRGPYLSSSGENTPNGSLKRISEGAHASKKRKRKSKPEKGSGNNGISKNKRRHSVSKPARDPRDDPSPTSNDLAGTRSPSPVIDFDGLSRPSMPCIQ